MIYHCVILIQVYRFFRGKNNKKELTYKNSQPAFLHASWLTIDWLTVILYCAIIF